MKWYIKSKKELSYELSEGFDSKEEAEEKLSHMHKKKKDKSEIISIPEIKNGSVLYKNGFIYFYVTGHSNSEWFLQKNLTDKNEIATPVRKEKMIDWFACKMLDAVEQYCDDIEFIDVRDTGGWNTEKEGD